MVATSTPTSIFLIGPMGAGKTTIGKRLARNLSMEFKDSDREIEVRTGVTISTIFDIEGEEGFRKREARMIEELTRRNNTVLATGGGAILRTENRQALVSRGTVIYLKTSIAQQLTRTRHDRNRPLLATEDPESRLRALMEIREPLYLQTAEIVIDTDHRHSSHVVGDIIRHLGVH